MRSTYRFPRALVVTLMIGAMSAGAQAADWPQWMGGPDRINQADGSSVKGLNVKEVRTVWETELGSGYSALSVSDGVAVAMFCDGKNDIVAALDAKSGDEKWRFVLDRQYDGHDGSISGPLSTPAIDGNRVYAVSGHGKFAALDLKTGKPVWTHDLKKEFRARQPYFGFATSPLVDGNRVTLLFRGNKNHGLWTFDKKSGELLWSAGGKRKIEYSSPTAVTIDGVRQIVGITDRGVFAVSAEDGKNLWSLTCKADDWATVHALPDNRLFLPMQDKFRLIKVTREDSNWNVEELWSRDDLGSNSSYFTYRDGHLYGSTKSALVCLDAANGEIKWQEPMSEGTAIAFGDKLVSLDRKAKQFRVAALSPKGYARQIVHTPFPDASHGNWTMPVAADGRIYVRNAEAFACLELVGSGS